MVGTAPSSRETSPVRTDDRTEVVKEGDTGEIRTSCRHQRLLPEYGLLHDPERSVETHPATAMTNAAAPTTVTFQQPKEPPKFHARLTRMAKHVREGRIVQQVKQVVGTTCFALSPRTLT